MNAKFKDLVETTQSEDRVKILEYTNKVPELMHISDAVITKAGGLTITECLTSHLPIIIMNPIPGQEEENADFLVNNNVAVWIKKDDSIARSLKTLSKDTEKLEELRENAKALAKPKATEDICKILVSEFDEIKNITNEIVVSALVNYKNKYLFIKNDEFIELPNFHLNINETPEKAIKHNFLKEFNLKLENLTSFNFDSKIITYKKKKYQVIFLIYTATVNKRNNLSNDKVLWLSKEDFSDYKQDKLLSKFLYLIC